MSNVSIDKSFLKIDGNAKSATTATKLTTARTIQTNLASTSTASFDGSKNITPGVTGILPVANGGTGSNKEKYLQLTGGTLTGSLNIPAPSAESNDTTVATTAWVNTKTNNYILKSGNRGTIAGYEVASEKTGSQTITIESPDTTYINTSGSVILTFTASTSTNVSTKVIYLTATGATTLTVQGCIWANGADAPTWGTSGKHLVLVASFIGGRVIVSVFDNDDI